MIVRCAWCKRITGTKPPFGGVFEDMVTDGICYECIEKYFPKPKQDEPPFFEKKERK